jgi:hypothetical protein
MIVLTTTGLLFVAACKTEQPPTPDASPALPPSPNTSTNAACTAAQGTPYDVYKNAFFGVLHQHTSYSIDAYTFGTRVTPAEAYQFAKGGVSMPIRGPLGPIVGPLTRPLDFLAITDHSEWLGLDHEVQGCSSSDITTTCQRFRNATQQAWDDEQQAAANAYEPCKFTSLVAYEWTSGMVNGQQTTNHRNVIFGTATVPTTPLDSKDFPTPQELFTGLDAQCTGNCAAIVIPHNTNMSKGLSLDLPANLTQSELDARQKYQRLVEIYQHKGNSECVAGGQDPECSFEHLKVAQGTIDNPNSYVREVLGNGIVYATTHASENPLQLGIIAAVDDHNGTPGWVDEDKFIGHLGVEDGAALNRLLAVPDFSPGGLAGVWAEQNTREAVYAALQRRETFGTSGPRMQVRFYQTTNASPCTADFPKTIVDGGAIPMGGSFGPANVGTMPSFAIAAWPDTAPQPTIDDVPGGRPALFASAAVIKVHAVTANGTTSMVEDPPSPVAIDPHGSCAVWTDNGYQPDEKALYYVRVLQEPTHRWSYYDCQSHPVVAGCGVGGALVAPIEERAWTSPIWFNP